jgi:hypothetical protein
MKIIDGRWVDGQVSVKFNEVFFNQAREIIDGRWVDGRASTDSDEVFGSSKRNDRWSMKERG